MVLLLGSSADPGLFGGVGVAVVWPGGDEGDTGYFHRPRGGRAAGEPDRGAGDGVQLAGGRRGQRYLVPRGGHAPGGEDDRYPFAGYRGIGEALDGDLAGLRTADTGVIDAGHVTVGGDGTQHPAGRPEVLPVETQERAQLPGLPEARRVGGGV